MSSGSYYEEEMSSGGHRRLTAFIFLVNSHSKKSLFLLTMGLAGRIQFRNRFHPASDIGVPNESAWSYKNSHNALSRSGAAAS